MECLEHVRAPALTRPFDHHLDSSDHAASVAENGTDRIDGESISAVVGTSRDLLHGATARCGFSGQCSSPTKANEPPMSTYGIQTSSVSHSSSKPMSASEITLSSGNERKWALIFPNQSGRRPRERRNQANSTVGT